MRLESPVITEDGIGIYDQVHVFKQLELFNASKCKIDPLAFYIFEGYCSLEEIEKAVNELPMLRLISVRYGLDEEDIKPNKFLYSVLSEGNIEIIGALELEIHDDFKYFRLSGCTKEIAEPILSKLTPLLRKAPEPNCVMVLVSSPGGLELKPIGRVNNPLIKYNYSSSVVHNYDHVVSCLNSKDPCGSLVLLSGPPGTGKSYMIRALMNDVDAMFVLIPSSLLGQLSGPSIFPVLTRNKQHDKPIVLLVEDADTCISMSARGNNPGALSDILNLGDGLFGQLMDVRVVATSNADRMQIDPAITRPGRMCKHLAIEPLPYYEANKTLKELVKKDIDLFTGGKVSLAEVYRAARADGWVPDKKDAKSPGQYV